MARQRFRESDPVEEILRIALNNEGGSDVTLRQRLLASAAELGISEEAALAAEQQWIDQNKKSEETKEYRSIILRGLYTHLGVYLVVNTFLILLNMLTSHGHVSWAFFPILGWGIGMGCHLVAAAVQFKNPGGDEFEAWRNHQRKAPSGVTIGLHIAAPKPVQDVSRDRNQSQA